MRGRSVLILGNYPPPFGGVPSHIESLCQHLSNRDWNVHVLPALGNPRYGWSTVKRFGRTHVHRLGRIDRFRLVVGSAVRPRSRPRQILKSFTARERLWIVSSARYAEQLIRAEAIAVVSAYHLLHNGLLGALLSKSEGIPLVTTIFGELYRSPEYHQRHRAAVELVISQSHRMLSCSEHCSRSLATMGFDTPVQTLYYGVDLELFHPRHEPTFLQQELKLPTGSPAVLYVARMTEEMGLRVLLEAIPDVLRARPDVVFVIAGQEGELTSEALAAERACPGHVFVRRNVTRSELPLFYASATVVVVPSTNHRACLGLSIAEAMATAKATIVADVGGAREVAVDGVTSRLIPPGDSASLARAVLELLDRPDDIVRFGALARERAEAGFDVEKTNARMEQVLEDAVG